MGKGGIRFGWVLCRKEYALKDTEATQHVRRERIWTLLYDHLNTTLTTEVEALATALNIHPLTARLLINRGYTDAQAAEMFLENDDRIWHDPFLMADMEPAVERTLAAVRDGERIVIYGDYDVDGVTSVTSLYLYLRSLGATVDCYIPNRLGEGYGMSIGAVDRLVKAGVDLFITVDTGITANAEIRHAAELGVDTVITDHHECHGELPFCTAVVNPHRPDCPYPFKELAGVGVVFKFICACETRRIGLSAQEAFEAMSRQYIDLVAIGTIADVMPLGDENRFIVSRGLAMLEHTERPGLAALLDAISGGSNTRPASANAPHPPKKPRRKINSGLVGYGIAPRINAAGRIAHAMQAVELLLEENPERAATLAEALCEINAHRQVEENRIAEQAYGMIDQQLAEAAEAGTALPRVIVLEDDGWMQGIVGIVSSRITEKYGLPSILISFDGAVGDTPFATDIGKGSGRSVKGLNLVDALSACEDLLVRYGGHELAAGLTIRRADIPEFRDRINAYAAERLTDDMTAVRYEADCTVEADELSMEVAEELERLEPFGVGNQTPLLILRNAVLQKAISLGNGRHTKLMLSAGEQTFQAVWFGMPASHLCVSAGDPVDLLFHLNINDYQGVRSLQLIVEDLRLSETFVAARLQERERLDAILGGAPITPEEQLLPTRDDIACVFTVLRHDARLGNRTITERQLTEYIKHTSRGMTSPIGWVKLHLILHILGEMGVASVQELEEGIFLFDVHFDAPKTSIDASPLLQSLRRALQP